MTPTMQLEQWRAVPGHEGRYEVSDMGRVRSLSYKNIRRTRVLRPAINIYRYPCLTLYQGSRTTRQIKTVHLLVLEAFVGPRPEGLVCRHMNGNPADNRLVNLRWGTPKENVADAIRHGTHLIGGRCQLSKLTDSQAEQILLAPANVTDKVLAEEFGVLRCTISSVRRGLNWKHILPHIARRGRVSTHQQAQTQVEAA